MVIVVAAMVLSQLTVCNSQEYSDSIWHSSQARVRVVKKSTKFCSHRVRHPDGRMINKRSTSSRLYLRRLAAFHLLVNLARHQHVLRAETTVVDVCNAKTVSVEIYNRFYTLSANGSALSL